MHIVTNQFQFTVDDEIVPNLRPEKDIWNLSNDEFYESKTKTEKTRGSLHALLQVRRGNIFTFIPMNVFRFLDGCI